MNLLDEDNHEKAIVNDSKKKRRWKYADRRNHAKKINSEVGDYVLVRQQNNK
jgi:hypothetical protein